MRNRIESNFGPTTTEHEARLYTKAWQTYTSFGSQLPPSEMPVEVLREVEDLLEPVSDYQAHIMRGWVNVELGFALNQQEDAGRQATQDSVSDGAVRAFTTALECAPQEYPEQYIYASTALAACEVNMLMAQGQQITDEIRQRYIASLAETAENALSLADQYVGYHDLQRIHAEEAIVTMLLALNSERGDTRKPVKTVAVPTTYRQRYSTADGTRSNWQITRYALTPEGMWLPSSKVLLQSAKSTEKPESSITPVDPQSALAGSHPAGAYNRNRALHVLLLYGRGYPLSEADKQELNAIQRTVRSATREHTT